MDRVAFAQIAKLRADTMGLDEIANYRIVSQLSEPNSGQKRLDLLNWNS